MKKKMLMVLMASMMLSMTACGSNNDSKNQETNTQEEAKDDVQKEDVQESENEEPEDVEGLEQYTDKDGNVYYYDINCVPEWWEGKVEVLEQGGTKYLAVVVENPNLVILFDETAAWRIGDSEESYKNYIVKKYVPEGWEIDYNNSTAYLKCLSNKDLDVQVEVNINGMLNTDMYWYDEKEMKICWNAGNSGNIVSVYEKPENIEYTVQTYEQYKGQENGSVYDYSMNKGNPYLFVRTYPDGRVFYDCFSEDAKDIMLSITEEDALKMQNAGIYTDIDSQFDVAMIAEKDSDFALFAWLYLDKAKFLDPDSDFYWGK